MGENAGAHTFLRIYSLVLVCLLGRAYGRSELSADEAGELEKLAKTYKIEIVTASTTFPVKTTYGPINGERASQKELQSYVRLFAAEFGLYPADLVRRTRLERVVLCRKLSFAQQTRNAVPDYEHNTLYLDVSRGSYNKPYLRKVIHHEFFHIIDLRDDGSVYKDERWAALNPGDFKYGNGGKMAQGRSSGSVLTAKLPGFLNSYSTTGVEEDKAEVFANMIVDPTYVSNRAKSDPVLAAKVKRMKELLFAFCPDMNDAFWEKVDKTKRTD